jgi:hypothetical protein
MRALSKTSLWESQLGDSPENMLNKLLKEVNEPPTREYKNPGRAFTMRIMTTAWKPLLATLTAKVLDKKVMRQAK